jgi:flagellar protein FliL
MAATPAPAPKTPPPEAPAEKTTEAAPAKPAVSGLKPWLPLLANLVLMPVLAYGTVSLFILPKIQPGAQGLSESGKGKGKSSAQTKEGDKQKVTVPLSAKVLVNVAGTMGTRYLLASLTLVGTNPDLKTLVEKNDAELRDRAASALSVKTISDLEKPGTRNLIRTELLSIFNNVLGENALSDIYLTEFAIQ